MSGNRNSSIELYRILLILAIIAHHYVVNSGLLQVMNVNQTFYKSVFYYLFGMWGKTCINCFVLITGYFMCTSKISLHKFLKLLLEVEFYHILFYSIFVVSGYTQFTLIGLFRAVWPLNSIYKGFISCFLIFYLLIPFLNVLVKNLDEKQHLRLLFLCLFIYTFLGTLPGINVQMNYVSWFCVLYLISSYFRLYDFLDKNNTKKWGLYFLFSLFLAVFTLLVVIFANDFWDKTWPVMYFVKDCNYILALLVSVCSFNFFRNYKMRYVKFINMLASSTFGVLLIHANSDLMRQWLWKDALNVVNHYYSAYFIFYAFVSVMIIYIVCVLIDQIRIRYIEIPFFSFLNKNIDNKFL